jgi:hypothetical protein
VLRVGAWGEILLGGWAALQPVGPRQLHPHPGHWACVSSAPDRGKPQGHAIGAQVCRRSLGRSIQAAVEFALAWLHRDRRSGIRFERRHGLFPPGPALRSGPRYDL